MENDIPLHTNIIAVTSSYVRKYIVEIGLIIAAACITILSLFQQSTAIVQSEAAVQPPKSPPLITSSPNRSVFVDVSGAVYKPGVYEATAGARIADLIEMAGGISYEADSYFVARNFNMARFVGDQDKIYIPYMFDIALGTFTEQKRILEYLQPLSTEYQAEKLASTQSADAHREDTKISINDASAEELDILPGVGSVTAQKIIENRPYITIEDLLNKKVMNQSTYDKIKSHIEL